MFGGISGKWLETAWKKLEYKGRRSDLTDEQKDALFFTAMYLKMEEEEQEKEKILQAKLNQAKQELSEMGLSIEYQGVGKLG